MSATLNPYLSFQDTAAQAMALYQSVFGGELSQTTFGEAGQGGPQDADRIMHAQLVTATGMTVMAADTPPGMESTPGGGPHSLSLNGGPDDADQLRGWFDGLSEGGTVKVPLAQAPWGDTFGMLTDRFGINWMVNIASS